jgi:hypothetical protein
VAPYADIRFWVSSNWMDCYVMRIFILDVDSRSKDLFFEASAYFDFGFENTRASSSNTTLEKSKHKHFIALFQI